MMFKMYMFFVKLVNKADVLGYMVLIAMLVFCLMFTAVLDLGAVISLITKLLSLR